MPEPRGVADGLDAGGACAGIGNTRDGLHPVQERLARAHGSQCGFCTPGFVMSMYALLRSRPDAPSEADIEENLAGNLWCAPGGARLSPARSSRGLRACAWRAIGLVARWRGCCSGGCRRLS